MTLLAVAAGQAIGQRFPQDSITTAEVAVMAAVLDAAYAGSAPGWVMVGSRTATFACSPPADIGMKIGECSGMRTDGETAARRLALVGADISEVTKELTVEIQRVNQRSSRLRERLPVKVPQELFATDEEANYTHRGNPAFAAYFSRPAIDKDGKRALIYLGTMNWTDASKSMGQYLYLEKTAAGWTVKGHSKVWVL